MKPHRPSTLISRLFLLCLILCFLQCKRSSGPYPIDKLLFSDIAMASSAHPKASDAAVEIMRLGGNAVDAAIATHFALAVVYPRAGNIGGGGFMMIRTAAGDVEALDFREQAPALAHRDMYLDSAGNVIAEKSRSGILSVGVPGSVDGMYRAHQRYGQLDWAVLLKPAIKLATEGFRIDMDEAERLNRYREEFVRHNGKGIPFVKDVDWREGDLLVQPELAKTLQAIARQGRAGFYKGVTAQAIVRTMKNMGGIITATDLEHYRAVWRKPIAVNYRGYRVFSMPPPSSGGIALAQILKIVEPYKLSGMDFHGPKHIHLLAEAERLAFADRAKHLGDPDFYPVPVDSLLSEKYLQVQSKSIRFDSARSSQTIYSKEDYEDIEHYETTHFSIVDSLGNAVSLTTTLNLNYGSKVFVKDAGFFLNDEMDDFSAKPGVPNFFGLIGNEANAIAPGKRMLSSMTPTIVEKDGELFMVLGTPGGSTIITTVAQIIINVIDFSMSLEDAVDAPRFHHQWLPDRITMEDAKFDSATIGQLVELGHHINYTRRIGLVDAVKLDRDKLIGVADKRGSDDAEAW